MSTIGNVHGLLVDRQATAGATASDKLRVVYLTGTGHSGSTLLAILLHAHPRVATVGETSIKPKIRHRGRGATQKCSCGALIANCDFWKDVFRRVSELGFELSASTWNNDYRFAHPLLHRLLSRRSSFPGHNRFQDWAAFHLPLYKNRIHHIGRVNVAFIRAILEIANADVFFDTSKRLVRLSRLLQLPELDIKVVRLLRDVRGYVASAKRRGYSLTDAIDSWKRTQKAVGDLTDPLADDRKLLVRYEDLCADGEETLRRLYGFCGVENINPFASPKLDRHHVIGNSMRFARTVRIRLDERWKAQLSADEVRRIMRLAGEMNRQWGYC